jgi:hypothetical protein
VEVVRVPKRGTPSESKYAPGKARCIAPNFEARHQWRV